MKVDTGTPRFATATRQQLDAAPKVASVNIICPPVVPPQKDCATGWLGYEVEFEDGSWWKLKKALSPVKYQQGDPPFEARQVFECVCTKDPNNCHSGIQEAVAKVKYQ